MMMMTMISLDHRRPCMVRVGLLLAVNELPLAETAAMMSTGTYLSLSCMC